MIVGVSRIELYIPEARSLKDKRQVMKSLAHKIAHRFNVSVSEVDNHDLWQRGTLGVAHVSNSRNEVEKLLRRITVFAEGSGNGEVVRCAYAFYDPEKD